MSLISVENPATGDFLGEIADFGELGIDEAAATAIECILDRRWLHLPVAQRQDILLRLADRLEQDREDLTLLATLESGQTHAHLTESASLFRLAASLLPATPAQPAVHAAILHWHQPLLLAAFHIARALASGHALLLKPSSLTPYSALRLTQLAEESGVPEGLIQVTTGLGRTTGDALARHPDVASLHFHGSTSTARRILIAAAESNLKHITLSHPHQPTHIITATADLHAATLDPSPGNYLVEAAVLDAFLDLLLPRIHARSNYSSLAGPAHLDRVLDLIRASKTQGATLISGGDPLDPPGHFLAPTVFTNVAAGARLLHEPHLAPIFTVLPYNTFNNTLPTTSTIHLWTQDATLAANLRAPNLSLNTNRPAGPSSQLRLHLSLH